MSQKKFLSFVSVLLVGVSLFAACGGGSGSSVPFAATAPDGPGEAASAGTATLAWDAPVTNMDGTALRDLEGYRVHYGTSPGTYTATLEVGNLTSYSIGGLLPGTYYMTVTAYNTSGAESDYSNEVTKTVM